MIENTANRRQTKHIDIRHHVVLGLFRKGFVTYPRVTSQLNHADNFTKAVPCGKHTYCCGAYGLAIYKSDAFKLSPTS